MREKKKEEEVGELFAQSASLPPSFVHLLALTLFFLSRRRHKEEEKAK